MSTIRIEWLSDTWDCETCGMSFAEGARVYVDGKLSLDLPPSAHCFGGNNYEQSEVFERILKSLGHEIETA